MGLDRSRKIDRYSGIRQLIDIAQEVKQDGQPKKFEQQHCGAEQKS